MKSKQGQIPLEKHSLCFSPGKPPVYVRPELRVQNPVGGAVSTEPHFEKGSGPFRKLSPDSKSSAFSLKKKMQLLMQQEAKSAGRNIQTFPQSFQIFPDPGWAAGPPCTNRMQCQDVMSVVIKQQQQPLVFCTSAACFYSCSYSSQ